MSNQRENSLSSLPDEIHALGERIKETMPRYTACLKGVSGLPSEFDRRFWVSRVQALVAKMKAEYEKYHAQAQSAGFTAKFATLAVDIALRAGGMEPIPPPESPRVGISLSPNGTIEPDLLNYPQRRPDAILFTFERFEAVAQRLGEEIMKGTAVPESEEDVPRLIYAVASQL